MLTRKQHELLMFIHARLKEDGVSPSFDEMKDALNLRSKSGIHRLISGLEERGFIKRLPHRARALEVVRLPEGLESGHVRPPRGQFHPNVIKGDFTNPPPGRETPQPRPSSERSEAGHSDVVQLPLYGRIAAGTPIEALRDHSNLVDVPAGMLASGDHYALEVAGDSMIEAGILDGDTVVIQRCDTADNGSIVVALVVEDNEATLKRLRRKGNTVALEPANAAYETRIFGADKVRVQGRLVGLLRKY